MYVEAASNSGASVSKGAAWVVKPRTKESEVLVNFMQTLGMTWQSHLICV